MSVFHPPINNRLDGLQRLTRSRSTTIRITKSDHIVIANSNIDGRELLHSWQYEGL